MQTLVRINRLGKIMCFKYKYGLCLNEVQNGARLTKFPRLWIKKNNISGLGEASIREYSLLIIVFFRLEWNGGRKWR
jgi:hypothetical protein